MHNRLELPVEQIAERMFPDLSYRDSLRAAPVRIDRGEY